MLSRLIALCLSQRLAILISTIALLAFGSAALRELPIDAFPDVSSTQVKIIIKAPGMTPEEIEARVRHRFEGAELPLPLDAGSLDAAALERLPQGLLRRPPNRGEELAGLLVGRVHEVPR